MKENKINTNLDNYFLNPYKFKYDDKLNMDNINVTDTTNDLNSIIQTLTSIIMSSNSNSINTTNLTYNSITDTKKINSKDNNYNINKINSCANNFNNKIFKLIANNKIEELNKFILNNNIDLNVQDNDGDTPLHISVFLCNFEAVKILILNGCDIYKKDKWGQIPLHRICFCIDNTNNSITDNKNCLNNLIKLIKIFDLFDKKNNNINESIFNSVDNFNNTPFHLVLKYLIKNKININEKHIELINELKLLTNTKIKNNDGYNIINLLKMLNN